MKSGATTILRLRTIAPNSAAPRQGLTTGCARPPGIGRCAAAFTLAEVLAALLFMAIVIPVAVQGLQIASRVGEVAVRKDEAARVAERILNENIVTTNWSQSTQRGTVFEGLHEFQWTLQNQVWSQGTTNQALPGQSASGQVNTAQPAVNQFAASQIPMNLLTVEVTYNVQNQPYAVRFSTLVPSQ